jgi:hypothetical protein
MGVSLRLADAHDGARSVEGHQPTFRQEITVMKSRIVLLCCLLSAAVPSASFAATTGNPLGIAIGNLLVGDYGSEGKVTAAFDPDGMVAMTFPDGGTAKQRWVADANFFCMIATPAADGKMGYRCERNLIQGKKLGEVWQQVDSEGKTVSISVQKRAR